MGVEHRVEVVVFHVQRSIGVSAGGGADAPIALEEEALRPRALHRDFIAEGNFDGTVDQHGVPQAVEVGLLRSSRGSGR